MWKEKTILSHTEAETTQWNCIKGEEKSKADELYKVSNIATHKEQPFTVNSNFYYKYFKIWFYIFGNECNLNWSHSKAGLVLQRTGPESMTSFCQVKESLQINNN